MTVNRDLRRLQKLGFVEKTGAGRGVVYMLTAQYRSIRPLDVEAYFAVDPEKRRIKERFDFNVFSVFGTIFEADELEGLQNLNATYRERLKRIPTAILKKEYERLTIDLAWKSSKIEGNTYTLLETEHLLREHKEPKGHTHEETLMVLNHKTALDYIRANTRVFKRLRVRDIEDVHSVLTKGLHVSRNIRNRIVRIGGTAYKPLDNSYQIKEALEKMCDLINDRRDPFSKAFIGMLMIAYIQPFEDGNKRTSRLVGNALLIADGACPLSFRSIDELEYKKVMLLFYEQNNYQFFKELFIKQFEFAATNYFE